MLKVHLSVKFRAGGITFGTLNRSWSFELHVPVPPTELLDFNERGVRLVLTLG